MKKTLYSALITFSVMCYSFVLTAQTGKARVPVLILDTASINSLVNRGSECLKRGQLDQTLIYTRFAIKKAKVIGYKTAICRAYILEGTVLYRKGQFKEALLPLQASFNIAYQIKDSVVQSDALKHLGNVYSFTGDYVKGLEFYFKGLAIEEKLPVQRNLHWFYNNIATSYAELKNFDKSLEYSHKALAIEKELHDSYALGFTLSNIGGVYGLLDKNDSSLYYFLKASIAAEEVRDSFALANSFTNIGVLYIKLHQYKKAKDYTVKAYQIAVSQQYTDLVGLNLDNFGNIAKANKEYDIAEKYFQQSAAISKEIGSKLLIRDSYLTLSDLYRFKSDYKRAYEHYKLYSEAKDSLLNEENTKLITEMNTKYTTEKKEKEIELLKKNEDIQKLELIKRKNELEKQRTVSFGAFIGFLLLMIVAILFFSRYRLKKKANDQLQHAYHLIEEKNVTIEKSSMMIMDSIVYAKRIQDAILPANEDLTQIFSNDFFILYKPSQIVSGDFYWCSTQHNKIIFAVADCTGHGVPGAFMSMIGNTLLNEIVNEHKVTDPQRIAELLNEKIILSLRQHAGSEKYDGMDISICMIDKANKEIQFTGAHHFMYTFNGHLEKIKGDMYSIGGAQQQHMKTFTSQKISYAEGLRLYFLTDGYCDQSGGESNKRFTSKRFEALLEEIQSLSMAGQKEKLEQAFEDWKGSTSQRDDILVAGIKC